MGKKPSEGLFTIDCALILTTHHTEITTEEENLILLDIMPATLNMGAFTSSICVL
jgi:hypothetical protein